MAISRSAVHTAAVDIEKSEDEAAVNRLARLETALLRRAQSDTNHPDLELTELLLNRHSGDNMQKLLQKLGASPASADDEPRGIPATTPPTGRRLDEWAQVYESDGTTIATDIERIRWDDTAGINSYRLVPFDRADGTMALKKRVATPAPVPPPPGTGGDRMVEVKNKKGDTVKMVKVKDGNADPKLEAILNEDHGTVDHFKQKSSFGTRG